MTDVVEDSGIDCEVFPNKIIQKRENINVAQVASTVDNVVIENVELFKKNEDRNNSLVKNESADSKTIKKLSELSKKIGFVKIIFKIMSI